MRWEASELRLETSTPASKLTKIATELGSRSKKFEVPTSNKLEGEE
jgi:hypothetical protein